MAEISYLANLNLRKNSLLNATIQTLTVAPSSPAIAQVYFNSQDDTLYIWTGTVWLDLGSDGVTNLGYTPAPSQGTVTSSTGNNAVIPVADGANAGLFTSAEKTKLSGIQPGAQADQSAAEVPSVPSGNLGATNVQSALQELQGDIDTLNNATHNLGITHNASDVDLSIGGGSGVTINEANATEAGVISSADKVKLDGIAAGATVNTVTNLAEANQTADTVDITSSDGNNATLLQADDTRAGLLTASKHAQIDDNSAEISTNAGNISTNTGNIATNAGNISSNTSAIGTNASAISSNATAIAGLDTNVSTNISTTHAASTVTVNSSDGTDGVINAATASLAGVMSSADKGKLNSIAPGAEVNVPDVVTSLALVANELKYVDELGATTDIDLSLYLDDTNLAYLTGGTLNGVTGIATFTRSDASSFTVDMSDLLDAITLNNTLTSTSTTEGLTANQGKVLKDLIDALAAANNGDEPNASTTTRGVVELATNTEIKAGTDSARAVTPSGLKSMLGWNSSLKTNLTYTTTIGDGSTTAIAVTHGIGSEFVQTAVYEGSDLVICEVELTSPTITTFKFNVAPALNAIRVVITGIN